MHSRSNMRELGARGYQLRAQTPVPQVQAGLNLFLDLKNPAQMPALLATIQDKMDAVRAALHGLHYVHFARFLPTRDYAMLLVITEFDGDLKSYIMDFVAVLGDVFTAILQFVKNAPRLPVNTYPQDFWEFIQKNNLAQVQPWSAYPESTVIDIQGVRRPVPPPVVDPPKATLDLDDIQSNVLRGYTANFARHFALKIIDPQLARKFIAELVPLAARASPKILNAVQWKRRPQYVLNVGFTYRGLERLGLPAETLRRFPEAFHRGPTYKDTKIDIPASLGDTGESAPSKWIFGNPNVPADLPDVLLSLFTRKQDELEGRTMRLRALFQRALREISHYDTQALHDSKRRRIVHFGYRDGIAQPRIAGAPGLKTNDMQPASAAGEFLLGKDYVNQYGGNFAGDLPSALCDNATYAAVRILKQDVWAFEDFLERTAKHTKLDPGFIAAKLMGRWRNGAPLTLAPVTEVEIPDDDLNEFDFAASAAHPTYYDDVDGLRCPMSSHIRRLNPRGALVTGKPHSRRIIRRGMPYGPAFDPKQPNDGKERGLFGLFICGDLEMQFEFLQSIWMNQDIATAGIRDMRDPIAGAQSEHGDKFEIRTTDERDPIVLNVPRWVTTRGSDYFFLPGIGGLRYLAKL